MPHRLAGPTRKIATLSLSLAACLSVYGQKSGGERPETSTLRQTAVIILDSSVDDLRAVEDVEARVTFAADILRLLGGVKPGRCRQMLDYLFDDIMKLRAAAGAQGGVQPSSADASLRKLIQAAATFDRQLARSYIDRYTEEAAAQGGESATASRQPSPQADLNMLLALQLLETDPGLATRVAEKAVAAAVTSRALEFLGNLRKKDPALANAFFATALQSVRARPGADVNELLLLYTYVFSPTRVLGLTPQGMVLRQIPGYQRVAQDYPVDPRLARQFLQTSAQILVTNAQFRQGNLGPGDWMSGDLYFINLIKPLAARYTPSLLGPLSEHGSLLVGYLQPEQYTRLQSDVERLSRLQTTPGAGAEKEASAVDSLLKRADALPQSAKRDHLYYMAAMAAVREKQYDAAADIAERVSPEARAKVKEFVGFSIAQQSVSEHQLERAEQWAQRDTDPARRAYVLTSIAGALVEDASRDYARATKFLVEAEQLGSKLDATREGISVLLREAEIYSRFDSLRASEALRLAFKATNRNEGFTGDGRVSRRLEVGGFSFFYEMFNDGQSLSRVLNRLAADDFYGTLSTIRELQNRTLRLRAVIYLCGGVLAAEAPSRPAEGR